VTVGWSHDVIHGAVACFFNWDLSVDSIATSLS
jgi:hypothetical protein